MELGAEEKCVARADKLQESHQLCRPLTRAAACALEPACMDAATAQAEAPAPCGHTSITGNFQTKFFWFLGFFFLFMAAPTARGSSQARGQEGAAAESYATATATLDP